MNEPRAIHTPPNGEPPTGVNPDVMRQTYRELDAKDRENIAKVKKLGTEFHQFLSTLGGSRELAIAKTKIEEVVMWAEKDITG